MPDARQFLHRQWLAARRHPAARLPSPRRPVRPDFCVATMTRLPRPNPAVYPRMYSKAGRYLHRAISANSTLAWCSKLKWTSYRAIEGRKPAQYLFLIQFDEHRAAKLQECPECKEKAGRFA